MKFWIGVTDNRWFEFLSASGCDEVNFWQPSARAPFVNLPPGTPFLFKLKRPYNHIAGGGYFVKYATLPLPVAWDAFDIKNGAATLKDLDNLVRPLARAEQGTLLEIGCTVLASPFFLPKDQWIPAPEDWSSNIVVGKTYDDHDEVGKRVWARIDESLQARDLSFPAMKERLPEYGAPFLSRARLGQGAFRVLVTEAYERKCAITGESILPVLEAAHIKPFAESGPNSTFNGMLLRSDFHKLFDMGLVTVTPDYCVKVSPRIRDEWYNGKAYYKLDGQTLKLPVDPLDHPRKDLLRWHGENRYVG